MRAEWRMRGWLLAAGAALLLPATAAQAGGAPAWMHAQAGGELPPHDAKTDAVLLYSDTVLTVSGPGKILRIDRRAYRILRPDGERRGIVRVEYGPQNRITALHGWTIPASGKDYEASDRDIIDSVIPDLENNELVTDVRTKILRLPAATVGSVVGYEVQQELRPYMLVDEWGVQDVDPVRESHYRLQLPPGWSYTAAWVNHAPLEATAGGAGHFEWSVQNVPAVPLERRMPPWRGVSQHMVVSLVPPAGSGQAAVQNWHDFGVWTQALLKDRRQATPALKQKVAALTAQAPTPLAKLQALAHFVQADIRYVAVELGIGGWQPHAAGEVLDHRFGDCKDKANLLSVMLNEVGIASYLLVINTERDSVRPDMPANLDFDHAVLAVVLGGIESPTLLATVEHPQLGRLLVFDPTDPYVPLGRLQGDLQGSYALLVSADGGELIKTPLLPAALAGVSRSGKAVLDADGNLKADLRDVMTGDRAAAQRAIFRNTTSETDRIRPVEALASAAFGSFDVVKASIVALNLPDAPLEWKYTLEVGHYAKAAGELMLVRPRLLGSKAQGFLETHEPRQSAIEFEGPQRDEDSFEIQLPAGFELDELPPPLDVEADYAAYHSKTEFKDHVLRYTRRFEIKQVSLPAARAEELRHLYRQIADDERGAAVFKVAAH